MSNVQGQINRISGEVTAQASLISQIATALEGKGAGGGVSLDVITAAELPASVTDGRIVVITSTTPSTIYVDTDEPASPVSGDVWVQIAEAAHHILFGNGVPVVRLGLKNAWQYNGVKWATVAGHYGSDGTWVQFSWTLPDVGVSLSECSWGEIAAISERGLAATYFEVGDTKPVSIGGTNYNLRIIGFDSDVDAKGNTIGITFMTSVCVAKIAMHSTDDNTMSWQGAALRSTLRDTYLPQLPEGLRSVIKEASKQTATSGFTSALITTADKLFLLSEAEVEGDFSTAINSHGTHYAFFATINSRKLTLNGNAASWWLRDPADLQNTAFVNINTSGASTGTAATTALGVAFAFCV